MAAVAASFQNRQEAEAARERLVGAGVSPSSIEISEPSGGEAGGGAGIFDQLAGFLAPGKNSAGSDYAGSDYIVTAEVEAPLLDAATGALQTEAQRREALRGRTYEFIETAEELVIEKQLFVHEEVVLRRTADERVEEVNETVRRTEVEVGRMEPDA
jgi:hypothetical protein